jgi:hypothetical protein
MSTPPAETIPFLPALLERRPVSPSSRRLDVIGEIIHACGSPGSATALISFLGATTS